MNIQATWTGMEERRSDVKLSRNPKDLFTVWKEWECVLNGSKPARDFTIHERGVNKFALSWHKNLWDVAICMIVHVGSLFSPVVTVTASCVSLVLGFFLL
jgi:hypothetical protein